MIVSEFQEIGHAGGKVTFTITTDTDGGRAFQVKVEHARPVPFVLIAIWALREGIPVAGIQLGGIGQAWNPPPVPGCFPVFISSDSRGKFGHECPDCDGYWRSDHGALKCPYCAAVGDWHDFLTAAQRRYVKQYCDLLNAALSDGPDGDHFIDMDAVADAVGPTEPKPEFYYAEQSQQNSFNCEECGSFNDVLGRFCYCSICGTRNDLQELRNDIVPKLRERTNSDSDHGKRVQEAVSVFDSFVDRYVREMVRRIPMRPARAARFNKRFHNLESVVSEIKSAFDIDLMVGLGADDLEFGQRMFLRRHVYEHKGGEVDERYLRDSGDTSVKLRQALHETTEDVHRLINLIVRMAESLHQGFHEIFPTDTGPIGRFAKLKQRRRDAMTDRSSTTRRTAPASEEKPA